MINVVHKRGDQPIAMWVTKKNYKVLEMEDDELLKCIVTSHRIHAWVNVRVNGVEFRTILAIMPGPFQSPQFESVPLIPFRCDSMQYPMGNNSFFEQFHIVEDAVNNPPRKMFVRSGLWYSTRLGKGTIVGYEDKIYIIPDEKIDQFEAGLASIGNDAFSGYESFDDPTLPFVGGDGMINELDPDKKWWQFWK